MIEATGAAPLVSIVMATYGRPEVLRWAIESARRQTLNDWELVVVGDACDDTTAQVVLAQAAQDSRIRFVNLQTNYGEQSGPNNVGVARSTGRYVAFLNQDDLWFDDHLAQLVDWLEASGSDLVYGLSAHLNPSLPEALAGQRWQFGVGGLGRGGRYDPLSTFSPASAWLMSRRVTDIVGPWRPALECGAESSQDYLFRAWRQGLRLRACPAITTLVFSSGTRPGSYQSTVDHEQAFFTQRLSEPAFLRATLTAQADLGEHHPFALDHARQPLVGWRRWFWAGLARAGVHPRAWQLRKRGGRASPGQYIQHLRSTRGLSALPAHATAAAIKEQAVLLLCDVLFDTLVDLSDQGTARCHLGRGWLPPEQPGSWSTAPRARLFLRLPKPSPSGALLHMTVRPFVTRRHCAQRLGVWANGHAVHEAVLQGGHDRELHIALNAESLADQDLLILDLDLPDTVSPAKVKWRASDQRPLGILVRSLTIKAL